MSTIQVNIMQLENGLYVLTFNGCPRGDAAKFNRRDAIVAAQSWDGKENGDWKNGVWVPSIYRCTL